MNFLIYIICTISLISFIILVWTVSTYNYLIRQFNLVAEGWSGIDVQLKRRIDLITNLVEIVKGYSTYEKDVFEKITSLRAAAQNAKGVSEKIKTDKGMTAALKTLFAVVEQYPDLKANQNYLMLQESLSQLEQDIQLACRYYNGTVRSYSIALHSFPANMIAPFFRFKQRSYFEIDDVDRTMPRVKF